MNRDNHLASTAHLPLVHSSIVSMLDHTCTHWGQQTAIVLGEELLSYIELRSCVWGLAQTLMRAGVADQRVATILPNSLTACIAPYAIAAAIGSCNNTTYSNPAKLPALFVASH
jgi:acyl-CoA synthetase (AMP-forming)/AMP-acid ligase II